MILLPFADAVMDMRLNEMPETFILTGKMPVFQMSVDTSQPPVYHFNLAKELFELRSKGVLVLASGNMVYHLSILSWDTNFKNDECYSV